TETASLTSAEASSRGALLCHPPSAAAQSPAEHATHDGHRAKGQCLSGASVTNDRNKCSRDPDGDDHSAGERREDKRHPATPIGHDGTRCHESEYGDADQHPTREAVDEPAEQTGAERGADPR